MANGKKGHAPRSTLLPSHLGFFLRVYLVGLFFFSIFRIIFLLSQLPQTQSIPWRIFMQAWLMGWRFDTVVSGYILLPPFLLAAIIGLTHRKGKLCKTPIFALLLVGYIVAFALFSVDIPYYKITNTHLTVTLITWLGDSQIAISSIIKYSFYLLFLLLFILCSGVFGYWLYRLWRAWTVRDQDPKNGRPTLIKHLAATIAVLALLGLGIRGRISFKSPIRWGTAFFSNHAFANQVGLNPAFTFVDSYLENRHIQSGHSIYMDEGTAIAEVRQWLKLPATTHHSPICRYIGRAGPARRYNVVLVIMESMCDALLGHSRLHDPPLTPHMNELLGQSCYFDNFYSSGTHTFNAIWELFSGLPNFPEAHNPLKDPESMIPFSGLAQVLSRSGYRTYFACPHDENFDNMGGFLRINGEQTFFTPSDFPDIKLSKPWNIPDHVMFEKILPQIRRVSLEPSPFFFTILTISNHPPYLLPLPLPEGFVPQSRERWAQTAEYADWALHRFLDQARQEPWFAKTIFVLVGDHGLNISPHFQINPRAHHIPLVFYAPGIIPPQVLSQIGQQMDVMPTLLDLLNLPYLNNTFGIDLFRELRPCAILCTDTTLGVLDRRYLLVAGRKTPSYLYEYNEEKTGDQISRNRDQAERMSTFGLSILQTAKLMIAERRTELPQPAAEKK